MHSHDKSGAPEPRKRTRCLRRSACQFGIAALAVLIALVALETVRRHKLYWYDVRQDYSYDFSPRASTSLQVAVTGEGLLLPAWEGRRGAAVLKLRVASRLFGWWFDPCIAVGTGSDFDRQCFERGASGIRYVLLPPAIVRPGQQVELRGEHLGWDAQTAELLLFDDLDLSDARILVLAPHPDDAEIAAFGLYSSYESFIVTMTAGNYVDGLYAGLHEDESSQDALRGTIRTWDSMAVPIWGGIPAERLVSLGYLTYSLPALHHAARGTTGTQEAASRPPAHYRQGAVERLLGGRSLEPTWESVVADLAAVLDSVKPDVVVSPHPALDAHLDHQYTTYALLEALERMQDDSTVLLLYDNHHVLAEHYPFGPSDSRVTLPPWFGGAEFASVFSFEIDVEAQMRKLFALEAMHDLRAPPLRLTGGPFDVLTDRFKQAYALIRRDPLGDYSYFRRAVRPNEVFFAYWPKDRPALRSTPGR